MVLFKKFLKNKDGAIAIQFGILILPLLALVGAGIDYSRIAVAKTNLQATLDNNVRSMPATAFRNRAEMEKYIVSLAGVNSRSNTIHADISIIEDKIHIDLKDKVKTPMLSLYGHSEIEVIASVDIKAQDIPSTMVNTKSASTFNKNATQQSRSEINNMKRQVYKRIAKIKDYKYLSDDSKRRMLKRLRKQLDNLKKLQPS